MDYQKRDCFNCSVLVNICQAQGATANGILVNIGEGANIGGTALMSNQRTAGLPSCCLNIPVLSMTADGWQLDGLPLFMRDGAGGHISYISSGHSHATATCLKSFKNLNIVSAH